MGGFEDEPAPYKEGLAANLDESPISLEGAPRFVIGLPTSSTSEEICLSPLSTLEGIPVSFARPNGLSKPNP